MSKDKVVDSLGRIDDDMIQSVEALRQKKKRPAWTKWGAMVACLCLIVASAVVIPRITDPSPFGVPIPNPDGTIQRGDEPDVYPDHPILRPGDEGYVSPGTEPAEGPWNPWQVHFNTVTGMLDAARRYIPGYFTEELSAEDLEALEPGMRIEYMQYSGHAGFDGDGNLIDIYLNVTTSIPDSDVSILISENGITRDYVMDMVEPVLSVCEKVEYKVYQWDNGNGQVTLAADAEINGYSFAFTMQTSTQDAKQAKEDFTRVLECFAYYAEGKPDLSAVVADEIPEWYDKSLSHQDALNDSDFGAFMLREIPSGFVAESIRRYKDQTEDYLSGLWTSGYDELRWKVYAISEADEGRLTSVADIENYDLSLYPIPRASSVPDDLREIVDNPIFDADELTIDVVWTRAYSTGEAGDSDGWRMAFSVRYGDTIVEVRTKGAEPEWLYQQLVNLISE